MSEYVFLNGEGLPTFCKLKISFSTWDVNVNRFESYLHGTGKLKTAEENFVSTVMTAKKLNLKDLALNRGGWSETPSHQPLHGIFDSPL